MLGSRHPAPTHFHSPLLAPQTTAAGLGVPETQTRHGHGGFVLVRGACWEQAMVEVKAKARPTGSGRSVPSSEIDGAQGWSFQSEPQKVRQQADRWRPETAVTRALINSSIQRAELVRVRGRETTWFLFARGMQSLSQPENPHCGCASIQFKIAAATWPARCLAAWREIGAANSTSDLQVDLSTSAPGAIAVHGRLSSLCARAQCNVRDGACAGACRARVFRTSSRFHLWKHARILIGPQVTAHGRSISGGTTAY